MSNPPLKHILEALVMTSHAPVSLQSLQKAFEVDNVPEESDFINAISQLQSDYQDRGIELVKLASGYIIQTRKEYQPWIERMQHEPPGQYSQAFLETLAIIAYKQPVTRGDIEGIRGVSVSSNIMKSLLEREWIRVLRYRDVPGKPAEYVTTKPFLDHFNLATLDDLPPLKAYGELFESLEVEPA